MTRAAWLALAGLALLLTPATAQTNLLKNPDFADGLAGWVVQPGDGPAVQPVVDRQVARREGGASLRFDTTPGVRGLVGQVGLPGDPRTDTWRFSVQVKCRNLPADWIIRIGIQQCRDGQVVRTLQNHHVLHERSMDWAPVRLEAKGFAPTDQVGVYVGVWYQDDSRPAAPPAGAAIWYADPVLAPVLPRTPPPAPKPDALLVDTLSPLGDRGLFAPGEPVALQLAGRNGRPGPVDLGVELRLKDYFGRAAEPRTLRLTLPPGEFSRQLDLPAPTGLGFHSVEARLSEGTTPLETRRTGFCVIPPPGPKDPYFVADVNGRETELVPELQKIGVAGRKIGALMRWLKPEDRGKLGGWWQELLTKGGLAPYWNSKLDLIGNIYLGAFNPPWIDAEVEARRKQGLYPYPDALFTLFGEFVEGFAKAAKGRIKLWVLSEEIDGTVGVPQPPGGSAAAEVMRYVTMSRIAYERLKQVDPENVVIGLAVSSDFNRTPRYPMVKQLLPDLKDYTDVIGPDLYSDNWNWLTEASRGPELGDFRGKILDTLKLQAVMGKPRRTCISERGYGLAYHLAPDDPLEQRLADLTARSLITAKSVPEVMFYALHMFASSTGWKVHAGETSDDDHPQLDLSLWKIALDRAGKPWYQPRSAVAAYATVARELAGATGGTEVLPREGVYVYPFTRLGGTVVAAWALEPVTLKISLPAATERVDLMGNRTSLPAGAATLELTASPVFLETGAAPDTMAAAFRAATG